MFHKCPTQWYGGFSIVKQNKTTIPLTELQGENKKIRI